VLRLRWTAKETKTDPRKPDDAPRSSRPAVDVDSPCLDDE
jgi:hypothetical protein